jgi:hypothetical protein
LGIISTLNVEFDTNIEIIDNNGNIIWRGHNTITDVGRGLLHLLLSSTAHIDSLVVSQLVNSGTSQRMFGDATYLDIINSYATSSGTYNYYNFEAYMSLEDLAGLSQLNSIGLAVGDKLFTVANTGGLVVGSTPLSILYQIKVRLIQQ